MPKHIFTSISLKTIPKANLAFQNTEYKQEHIIFIQGMGLSTYSSISPHPSALF